MDKMKCIRENELFAGLSEKQLQVIYDEAEEVNVNAGEIIIRENEVSDDIFILLAGGLRVSKVDPQTQLQLTIRDLESGAVIGEVSLVDNKPRSATVTATRKSSLLKLSISKLSKLGYGETVFEKFMRIPRAATSFTRELPIFVIMTQNIAKQLADRLRYTNDNVVEGLRNELMHVKARVALSRFIVNVLVVVCFYVFAVKLIQLFVPNTVSSTYISSVLGVLMGIPLFMMMVSSGYPLSMYGLTTHNWKKAVIESLLFTIPVLCLIVFYKFLLLKFNPNFASHHLFDMCWSGNVENDASVSSTSKFLIVLLYCVFVPVQELFARGAFQSSLRWLLISDHVTILSILISNLLFSVMHTHVSVTFSVVVLIPGLFWGWLYSRHNTLIGVTLSHWIIGFFAFFVVVLV